MSSQTKSVPMSHKLAFGAGMLANQMFPAALGVFMVVLVQGLGFPPILWGLIFFAPRIFDAITDPLMGYISDNTRSKWGRRRKYVFIGALIMGISYVFMWQLHPENSLMYNFTYFMIWSFIFYLGVTIFGVPYVAMGYEMSEDFHERTQIMAIAQFIGQWAWVIAPWFWVIFFDHGELFQSAVNNEYTWISTLLPENGWFASSDAAVRETSIWVAVVCTILAMIPAFFIKSKSTLDDESLTPIKLNNIGKVLREVWASFKEAFAITQFRKLCIATFFIYNSFNTIAAFSFFIIVHYLFSGDAGAAGVWPALHGCIGALMTTFLVIPIVASISKRIGKKRTFLISQGVSIFGYILFWFLFVPGKPYLFLIALPFFSFGIGALFTLMMSMTADVCDLDELNTGKRREGQFGAIYWWMVKFGFAIAGGLSGVIMASVGFDPEASVQVEGAMTGMRLFYTFFPIAGTLIAMYAMWNYDLTEERAAEVRAALAARKKA